MNRRARFSKVLSGAFFLALGVFLIYAALSYDPGPSVPETLRAAESPVCWGSGLLFTLAGSKLLYDARHVAESGRRED